MKTTRAVVLMAVLLLSAALVHAQSTQVFVSNVQVTQRAFSGLVDITYDLETVGDIAVTVNLFLSTDGGATYSHFCRAVSGDVGAGVLPGASRHIVWDAGTELPGYGCSTCQLRVVADDAGNLDDFVCIDPGTFMMGSPTTEPGRNSNETQHQVTLAHGFYVQTTEVTNQQYMELAQWAYDHGYATATSDNLYDNLDGSTQLLKALGAGTPEMTFSGGVISCTNPTHPVQYVTWYGSVAYCDWLSLQQGLPRAYSHATWQCNGGSPYTAIGYRLPTEAEWEYACRAGSTMALANGPITYPTGCDPVDPNLGLMGWYCANAADFRHQVAQKQPNAWGLYDMHGNVEEWCNDGYDLYGGDVSDPTGLQVGVNYGMPVTRGGHYWTTAVYCRSAYRLSWPATHRYRDKGFRAARSVDSGTLQTGTITIDPEPNGISAPWQISGPSEFTQSGTGDLTLEAMGAGSYTLTWGAVTGWTLPNPATSTQTLPIGDVVTFSGLYAPYLPPTGTITIDPEPNSISAPWQLAGPGEFMQSGTGDLTLEAMITGDYTLTWGAVAGWVRPNPITSTQALTLGGVVTFGGLYVTDPGAPGGLVLIPAGTFIMGSPTTELLRYTNETQHQVTLTHGIYVQTTEVTNQQYRDMAQWAYDHGYVTATSTYLYDSLDGSTQILNSLGTGGYEMTFSGGVFSCINPTHPVKYVTWYGSVAYCDWLSLQQGLPRAYSHSTWECNSGNPYTAAGYRLPTEAEWEYACRAGTQTPFHTGSCLDAGTGANYNGNYPYTGCPSGPYVGGTVPVGGYPANAFGLYDMHGNGKEWCNDWYGTYVGTVTDPTGPGAGSYRVVRGGGWGGHAQYCRSAFRPVNYPYNASPDLGFRPVRSAN